VAVITGAASGIGLGIAKRAVMEGMKVVIADIEKEALSSAEIILKKMVDHILAVHTDVSKVEEVVSFPYKFRHFEAPYVLYIDFSKSLDVYFIIMYKLITNKRRINNKWLFTSSKVLIWKIKIICG
jgi:hypothetical protein